MNNDSRPLSVEPEYVAARSVLLDALHALGPHAQAVVLVGAQAVYLRTGESDLAIAPFTTDADLIIQPTELLDEPLLADVLQRFGFSLVHGPGTWSLRGVHVDLMVPASLSGKGRRSAQLGVHGTDVARKAAGLEASLVDFSIMTLHALESSDARRVDVKVAGTAGLLISKVHKLSERESTPGRWSPKDGLDVLRILRATDSAELGQRLMELANDRLAGPSTTHARAEFERLFAPRGHGIAMLVRAVTGVEDPDVMAASCHVLASQLLKHWPPIG